MANVEGYGAAKPKTGGNAKALDRHRGYAATMSACSDKTKTCCPASSRHNRWEGKGDLKGNQNEIGQHSERASTSAKKTY